MVSTAHFFPIKQETSLETQHKLHHFNPQADQIPADTCKEIFLITLINVPNMKRKAKATPCCLASLSIKEQL